MFVKARGRYLHFESVSRLRMKKTERTRMAMPQVRTSRRMKKTEMVMRPQVPTSQTEMVMPQVPTSQPTEMVMPQVPTSQPTEMVMPEVMPQVRTSRMKKTERTRMPQVRTSLSKSKAHPTRRRQSWMDYFINLLNTDKLIVYFYVLLRQFAVAPDICFGGVVGIIVGAAIGIARGLAGTALGVLTAVCILIGLVVGAHGSDGRRGSTVAIGIAVLVGTVAKVVSTLIVIGIAILHVVFKEERFTTGISVGSFVCGLIPAVTPHNEFIVTSLAASLGVAIGISISAIAHASKYSGAVGVGATVAAIICVCATDHDHIHGVAFVATGFHIATGFGENANAAATGVSIATAGIMAHVIMVGITIGINKATFSTLEYATIYLYISMFMRGESNLFLFFLEDINNTNIASAFIGASGGVVPFAYFAGCLAVNDVVSLVYCAALCGISVGVVFAVAARRTYFVIVVSGAAGFVAGIFLAYSLLLPNCNFDHVYMACWLYISISVIIAGKALLDTYSLEASAGFLCYVYVHYFQSFPKHFKIIIGMCFIIALFGLSSIKTRNSKLEIKWKIIKEQLTSVCNQTGKFIICMHCLVFDNDCYCI